MVLLVFAALLAAMPTYAQARPKPKPISKPVGAQRQTWPLERLSVKGNQMYSEQQIIAASGLRPGGNVTKADFDAARDRLVATGAFQSVGYEFAPSADGKGYDGVFEVSEIEQRYPYRFERLPGSDAELRAVVKKQETLFADEIPGTEQVLKRLASGVQDFVAQRGFKDKVIAKIVSSRAGDLAVVFRPATPAPSVSEVHFTGSQVLPQSILQRKFAEVAVGVPYSEPAIRELLNTTIVPLYEARGHLRVSFPKIDADKSKGDVEGIPITVQVDEGPTFNIGRVAAETQGLPRDEVLALAKLKSGDLANFDAVKAGLNRVRDKFHHEGYMRADVIAERHMNDQAKTVDLIIKATPGPQYHMGALKVEGLDVISEPAVRKLWAMTAGKPYNADYPGYFLDQIKAGGYFDNLRSTRFEQQINEAEHTVDVTLYFKGGSDPNQQKRKPEPPDPAPQGGMGGGWPPWD